MEIDRVASTVCHLLHSWLCSQRVRCFQLSVLDYQPQYLHCQPGHDLYLSVSTRPFCDNATYTDSPTPSPLLELANYHVLGRLLYYVPYCAPLPPNRIMSLFGALVAIVEALNGLGVAFTSNSSSSQSVQELGSKLTKASLAVHLAVIVVCIVLAGMFYRNCLSAGIRRRNVTTPLTILCSSMVLILIRCIYRLVEHLGNMGLAIDDLEAMRQLSPILRYEWYFYVFESTTMLLNSAIWNIWHPGRYLPGLHNIHLSPEGNEVEAEENLDTRPLLTKAGSILTFAILFRKKKTEYQPEYALVSGS